MDCRISVFWLIAAISLLAGCTQPMPGSDRDSHGCIPSAGYSWCEAKQKCIRPWEENCTTTCTQEARICPDGTPVERTGPDCQFAPCPQLVGNDSDEHGCKGSAGYTWCEAKQMCIRPWEENCTPSLEDSARSFCNDENVAAIYTCGPYVRVVSSLLGGGSTFYKDGEEVARCPLVAPDAESGQCRLLLHGNDCVEAEYKCPAPGSDRDSHGCIVSAGYAWCEVKQKCLRLWEEPCGSRMTYKRAADIAINSSCATVGNLTGEPSYNNNTRTWWFNLDATKPGCAPACVVYEDNNSAEVNWRCTGVYPK